MDGIIETVKVKRDCPRGYKIINKSDYDPKRHELLEPAEAGPTVAELKDQLKSAGVSIPRGATKAEMIELLASAEKE